MGDTIVQRLAQNPAVILVYLLREERSVGNLPKGNAPYAGEYLVNGREQRTVEMPVIKRIALRILEVPCDPHDRGCKQMCLLWFRQEHQTRTSQFPVNR